MKARLGLIAALYAFSLLGARAQVYSINVVGYINLTLRPGLNLLVNQLHAQTDDLSDFMPTVPDGTVVFRFDSDRQTYSEGVTFLDHFGWYPASGKTNDPVRTIPLGEGFFVFIPGSTQAVVTFVGEVALHSELALPVDYSLKGSVIPQAEPLPDLGFPAAEGDRVYQWDTATQRFNPPAVYSLNNPGWAPQDPVLAVGEGFLLFRDPAIGAGLWVRDFHFGPSPLPPPAPAVKAVGGTNLRINSLRLPKGSVSLDIANSNNAAFDVQFSPDGLNWKTISQNQSGTTWKGPASSAKSGYFRLTKPAN